MVCLFVVGLNTVTRRDIIRKASASLTRIPADLKDMGSLIILGLYAVFAIVVKVIVGDSFFVVYKLVVEFAGLVLVPDSLQRKVWCDFLQFLQGSA